MNKIPYKKIFERACKHIGGGCALNETVFPCHELGKGKNKYKNCTECMVDLLQSTTFSPKDMIYDPNTQVFLGANKPRKRVAEIMRTDFLRNGKIKIEMEFENSILLSEFLDCFTEL